jgi:hypothetical protein
MSDHPRIPANDDGDFDPYHERQSRRFDWSRGMLTPEQDAALEALAKMPMTPEKEMILRAIAAGEWPPR